MQYATPLQRITAYPGAYAPEGGVRLKNPLKGENQIPYRICRVRTIREDIRQNRAVRG